MAPNMPGCTQATAVIHTVHDNSIAPMQQHTSECRHSASRRRITSLAAQLGGAANSSMAQAACAGCGVCVKHANRNTALTPALCRAV